MKIVFITGAGISINSNIASYRGVGSKSARTFSTISRVTEKESLKKHFDNLKQHIKSCEPNRLHKLVAEFDKYHDTTVVTQNIDDLHEKAGSKNIIHAHGCVFHGNDEIPDVVLFGEQIKYRASIDQYVANCDMLIYLGTSGSVYPINAYVDLCSAKTIEINVDKTFISDRFDISMIGNAEEALEKLLNDTKNSN